MIRKVVMGIILFVGCLLFTTQALAQEGSKAQIRKQLLEQAQAEIKLLKEKLHEALERLEKLEKLRGMAHYRFPSQMELLGVKLPLERRDLWERMDREFLILVNDVPQVLLWMKRANRYFPLIEERIRVRGLPQDLKYVAIVESSLRPEARSSAGAVGIWQFIASTGSLYQLEINNWVDERQDPLRSTEAALSYLEYLYSKFGDWILALAAYNAGEERVRREMARQEVSSFYDLMLPSETERYVFKIASAKLILSDPKAYGFELSPEELYESHKVELVELDVPGDLELAPLARACGMTYRALRTLNPHIRDSWLPKGSYRLYAPEGKGRQIQEFVRTKTLSAAPRSKAGSATLRAEPTNQSSQTKIVHNVQEKETLWDIAKKYGVQVKSLQQWNKLGAQDKIQPGQRLVIHR
ncbi:MAG: transglycosylase SLT domain-containing protein [bacterium]